jgi:hypothetical protein
MYAYVENERPIYFSLKLYLNSVAVHTSGSCYTLTGENTSTYLYTMSAIPATATQLWARANHDMADPWRNIYAYYITVVEACKLELLRVCA